ncbi:MAG: choice-of-anchor Q domain-containing protein, partial [Crocinitomicaceae bacterium]
MKTTLQFEKYIFILFTLLGVNLFSQTNYYVSTTGDDVSGLGTSGNPYATIQKVINTYNLGPGDTIHVKAGTYSEKGITLGNDDDNFTIEGAALDINGDPTSIFDSDQSERWMEIGYDINTGLTINNIMVKDYKPNSTGSVTGSGGGIYIGNSDISTLAINNCVFENCDVNGTTWDNQGGAIYFDNSNLTNTFSLSITGCSFYDCSARGLSGGAIYVYDYDQIFINISKSKFYDNSTTSTAWGYAVGLDGGSGSSTAITNCLFYNNSTNSNGNGVLWTGADVSTIIYNSTFYGNTCSGCTAAGYYNQGNASVFNSILMSNTSKDLYDGGTGSMTKSFYTSSTGYSLSGCSTSDPLFIDVAGNDFHLQDTSPAIDFGQVAGAPTDDLDNFTRISNPDAGCYERNPCPNGDISDVDNGGVYYIGPTGDWATLTDALVELKSCMVGTTTLEIEPTYDETTETYPIDFNGLPAGMSSTFHLTIRPKSDVVSTITFDDSQTSTLFDFNGCKYIYVDGRPGGSGSNKYFTIENTSSATSGSAINFSNDAT